MTTQFPDRSRLRVVALLAAPLTAFFLIQTLVGLASLAAIGRLGDTALAGVGIANVLFGLLMALLFGIDTGVQAIVARQTGAGTPPAAAQTLLNGMTLGAAAGLVLAVLAWFAAPVALQALAPNAASAAAGIAFIKAAAPALVLFGLTIPANAYWIGSGTPSVSFRITLLTAPCQVVAIYALVWGGWGTAGVGLATTLAGMIALFAQLTTMLRLRPVAGLTRQRPTRAGMAAIAAIGWPVSVQQALAQVALMIAFSIVARLGAAPVAVINVLASLMTAPIQLAVGLAAAAATLVGQALGRGDIAGARRWGWTMAASGMLLALPLSVLVLAAPEPVLRLFIHNPDTLQTAVWPARLLALSLSLDALVRILGFAFRGAGATRIATAVPFLLQFVLQLPLMAWAALGLGYGLRGVVASQVAITVVEAGILAALWRGSLWTRVRIGGVAPATADRPAADEHKAWRRVVVMGGAGAGKSTFARALGERLRLPVTHLDRHMYGPGWARLETQVSRQTVGQIAAQGRWIIEGSYREVGDLTLPAADLVVWLEQPAMVRLGRAWWKTVKHAGRPRTDRPDGCEEGFGLHYVRQILGLGRLTAVADAGLRQASPRATHLRLRGDAQVAAFLASLPEAASQARPRTMTTAPTQAKAAL